jgi:hypothetical protein
MGDIFSLRIIIIICERNVSAIASVILGLYG